MGFWCISMVRLVTRVGERLWGGAEVNVSGSSVETDVTLRCGRTPGNRSLASSLSDTRTLAGVELDR